MQYLWNTIYFYKTKQQKTTETNDIIWLGWDATMLWFSNKINFLEIGENFCFRIPEKVALSFSRHFL